MVLSNAAVGSSQKEEPLGSKSNVDLKDEVELAAKAPSDKRASSLAESMPYPQHIVFPPENAAQSYCFSKYNDHGAVLNVVDL